MRQTKITLKIIHLSVIMLVVAVMGSHVLFAAEPELTAVKIKGTNYEIEIPGNWKQGAFSGESILLCRSRGGKLYPNINVAIQDSDNRSLSQAFKGWLAILNQPDVFKEEVTTINGIPAHFSMISWSSLLGGLKALSLFVEQDNKHIKITYVAKGDDATSADINLYMKSLNTLHQIR